MVKPEHTWKKLIVYILGYFLLAEWLLPLPEAAGTGSVTVFMVVSAAFFIVIYLRPPWWAIIGSVLLVILAGINTVFYEESLLQLSWLISLAAEVQTNAGYIVSGQWYALTDMFRSVLFMLLLAIMSYLIYFWVVQSRRILFFLTFTIIYIGIMDTFFEYDGMFAIIRTFVIGFLLLGLLQWDRIVSRAADRQAQRKVFVRWTLIMAVFLIIAGGVGVLAPKSEPRWPDPVPFLTWGESSTGSSEGVQKIGYDGTDERLGGGFQMSDMPVFTASGDINGYWRGEAKNVYTGLGWEIDAPDETSSEAGLYNENIETEQQEVNIEMAESQGFDFAFYPGSFLSIEEDIETSVDTWTTQAEFETGGEPASLTNYTVEYETADFPVEQMSAVTDNSEDPEEITEYFTQLPDDLPAEIQELAEDLTEEDDNRYAKARAVERYLRGPDFSYQTTNIPAPSEGGDYVSQFLFESRTGYCDNYSTSMAVLLRTLDIPTRWVKGFTEGDQAPGNENQVEVTNENAHSWVEVYFPEVGWVPFEPTKGFSSEFNYTYENNEASEEAPEIEEEEAEEEEAAPEEEEAAPETGEEGEEEQDDTSGGAGIDWRLPLWPLLAAVVMLLGAGWLFRRKLLGTYLLFKYRHMHSDAEFQSAYQALMRLLQTARVKRTAGETLREFAGRVNDIYGSSDMEHLTEKYERLYYGRKTGDGAEPETVAAWKRLVKKIRS